MQKSTTVGTTDAERTIGTEEAERAAEAFKPHNLWLQKFWLISL